MEEAAVSMPLIGTALGGDCDLSTGGFSKLCLVIRGKDLHFLDRVGIDGDVGSTVVAGVDVGSAVDGEFVLIGARAVHVEGIDASGARSMAVDHSRDAWNQSHIIKHVAPIQAQLAQLLAGA